MAYTVYEYAAVDVAGAPKEPAKKRTASQALGAAFKLLDSTVYAIVVPDANMYFRVTEDGAAPTAADTKYLTGAPIGMPIIKSGSNYMHGITAP